MLESAASLIDASVLSMHTTDWMSDNGLDEYRRDASKKVYANALSFFIAPG